MLRNLCKSYLVSLLACLFPCCVVTLAKTSRVMLSPPGHPYLASILKSIYSSIINSNVISGVCVDVLCQVRDSVHDFLRVLNKGSVNFATILFCPSTDVTFLLYSVNIVNCIDFSQVEVILNSWEELHLCMVIYPPMCCGTGFTDKLGDSFRCSHDI